MGQKTTTQILIPDPDNPGTFISQGVVVTDTRTLADAQAEALIRVAQQFAAIIATGRVIAGKTYQIDDASRNAMLATWNNNAWPVTWIAMDNSSISLTQAQFQAGALNVLQYYNAMILNQRAHKNNIAALTSIAACDLYDVTTGWPS